MNLFLAALLFNALLALLYAIGELTVPRRGEKNWLLFGVFACLGAMMLHGWALLDGALVRVPGLLGWHFPCFLALGPLLGRYIQRRLDLPAGPRWWLHLAPAALSVLLLLFFTLIGDSAVNRYWIGELQSLRMPGPALVLIWLSNLHFIAYVAQSAARVAGVLRMSLFRSEPVVRILFYILGAAGLASLLVLAGFITGQRNLIALSLGLLGLLMPGLYIIRRRVPSFFDDLEIVVRQEKYRTSQLKNADLGEIGRRLEELMERERVYRDETLSLGSLAERLALSSHQLSEFFNNHLKINFARYVNRRRVREARELLTREPRLTVLHVAYRVGFNSKSSFNSAFARETGESPTAYRRKNESAREKKG